MTNTLSLPLLFLFIILLANLLKRAGMFTEKDGHVLSQITLNITLPAAIISGFGSFVLVPSLFLLILLGILINATLMGSAYLVISLRYLVAIVFSVLIWKLTSYEPMVKVTLTLLFFAPVATVSTAYTQQCTDKGKLSSFTSSVTVVISTICYIVLVPLLGA